MLLTLIKRAVKGALHDAVEEWAFETGLPQTVIQQMRQKRQAIAARMEAQADDRAVRALGVEEEDDADKPLALPMPSAARITAPDVCPTPDAGEDALLAWVHGRREANAPWAEVARLANEAGHAVAEDALRMRYRRWKEKLAQNGDDGTTN